MSAAEVLSYASLLPARKKVKAKRTVAYQPVTVPPGSTKKRKRVGRGRSAGQGKTCGRGQKGQKARSGYSYMAGFEGGQMPLHRRLPKRGFTNIFKKMHQPVNLWALSSANLSGDVNAKILFEKGIIQRADRPVKILGTGEIKNSVKIIADGFSASAREKIEKAGGSCRLVNEGKKKLRRFPPKKPRVPVKK